ncbi:hypothetical protein Tco_0434798 [Tanacetum coccineum]
MMVVARSDGCDEMKVVVAWSTHCGGSSGGEGDGVVVMGDVVVESGDCTVDPSEVLSVRESHNSRDSIPLKGKYIEENLLALFVTPPDEAWTEYVYEGMTS